MFNNIHGLFIVVILYFTGTKISRKEWLGVSLAILGCIFVLCDPKAARAGGQESSIVAAMIDIGSAVFGAVFFLLSARNVKAIPICLLIFIMNFHTFLFNSGIAKLEDSQITVFSFDPDTGCFGFLNFNQPVLPLVLFMVFASFFGLAGYTLSLLFFSPLVSSSAYLLEPIFAQGLGYAVGLDLLPGFMTILGSIFAIYGIMYIDRGSRERVILEIK